MGRQITISAMTGTQDYHLYVCDNSSLTCVYISTFDDADLPYTTLIPSPFDTVDDYCIKIVDSNNCEIINCY